MDEKRAQRKTRIEAEIEKVDEELRRERDELERRIQEIDRERQQLSCAWTYMVTGAYGDDDKVPEYIPELSAPDIDEDAGMTERIKKILAVNNELLPVQVRDLLVESGFSLKGRSNPMAEIHLVLKRLVKQTKNRKTGKITAHETQRGTVYKFNEYLPPEEVVQDGSTPPKLKKRA